MTYFLAVIISISADTFRVQTYSMLNFRNFVLFLNFSQLLCFAFGNAVRVIVFWHKFNHFPHSLANKHITLGSIVFILTLYARIFVIQSEKSDQAPEFRVSVSSKPGKWWKLGVQLINTRLSKSNEYQ